MAIDGVLLNGLSKELEKNLVSGRVDKVYQPESDEIHILIRNQGENHRLVLSASPNHPRLHLTKQNKSNPLSPPMFCMVLRKHLQGSRLLSIHQPNFERILEISFEAMNDMGDFTIKKLIIEIMGRHSNIIFVDNNNTIIDSIKHIGESISRVRQVLPGRTYVYPPSQGKTDPRLANEELIQGLLDNHSDSLKSIRILTDSFNGISKITAEEIASMGSEKDSGIANAFTLFFERINSSAFEPCLLVADDNKPKDILPYPYGIFHTELIRVYPSFSEALDDFFLTRDMIERGNQRTAHIQKIIKTNLDRSYKKLALLLDEVDEAKKGDIYRIYGELIIANIYNMPSDVDEVSLYNYYDSDGSYLVIPLDRTKTAAQNAQSYYKQYNKTKTVIEKHSELIRDTQIEIEYLESLAEHLSKLTDEIDILAVREELIKEGYIKKTADKNKSKSAAASKPHHYISTDGFEIFVGKNNLQNDYLTLKMATSTDLWLHTKIIPGSHVIVKTMGKEVPDTTLMEAANLAAYYSKGRSSANVPVDYCLKKNVKKPGGAKPGMVIYEHNNTVYITPSEEIIKGIKRL